MHAMTVDVVTLRWPTEEMRRREPASVEEFADIWYSPATWERLQKITIRD